MKSVIYAVSAAFPATYLVSEYQAPFAAILWMLLVMAAYGHFEMTPAFENTVEENAGTSEK